VLKHRTVWRTKTLPIELKLRGDVLYDHVILQIKFHNFWSSLGWVLRIVLWVVSGWQRHRTVRRLLSGVLVFFSSWSKNIIQISWIFRTTLLRPFSSSSNFYRIFGAHLIRVLLFLLELCLLSNAGPSCVANLLLLSWVFLSWFPILWSCCGNFWGFFLCLLAGLCPFLLGPCRAIVLLCPCRPACHGRTSGVTRRTIRRVLAYVFSCGVLSVPLIRRASADHPAFIGGPSGVCCRGKLALFVHLFQ